MVNSMENTEEVMQILERFTRLKQKEIPKELDDYLQYVAKTGDTIFKWASLKYLFREKLLNVIKHFHDTTQRVDEIPQYPNVDPFNYESMKSSLLERLELFNAAPFTVQRLCELLIDPRKQYNRIDKYMRALEKNILVVSTIEPGRKRTESENGDSLDSVVNGDISLDVNVDIDMENESLFNLEPQNGNNGNGSHAIVEEIPAADAKVAKEPVLETPNVLHATDDDILPNPKKAKLDLDIDEEGELEKLDNILDKEVKEAKDEKISETDNLKEAQEKGENTTSIDSKDTDKEENKIEKEEDGKENKPEKNNVSNEIKSEGNIVEQETIVEKAAVEDIPEKNIVEEAAVSSTSEKADNKIKESDSEIQRVENDEAIENKINAVVGEKIVEKDVIEKSEKEQKEEKSVEENDKEVISEIKVSETKKLPTDDNTKKETASIGKSSAVVLNEIQESTKPIDDESKESAEIEKTPPVALTANDDKNAAADALAKESSKNNVESNEDKEDVTAESTQHNNDNNSITPINLQTEKTETDHESIEEKPIQENVDSTMPVEAKDKEPLESSPENKNVEEIKNDKTPDAVTTSEQPMEDNAEDDVTTSTAVEEVVMAETTSNTATDVMSTDIADSEPSKDEPAGMEVDDTSQEAMDQ